VLLQIKELEDEVLRQRSTSEQLSITVKQAQETISRLELQLALATSSPGQQGHAQSDKQIGPAGQGLSRREGNASGSVASTNIAQLEALLNEQLDKNLKLEEQLGKSKVGTMQILGQAVLFPWTRVATPLINMTDPSSNPVEQATSCVCDMAAGTLGCGRGAPSCHH
jgi:hypothetical protein